MTAQDAVQWEKLIFIFRLVSVGAAYMNNHAFPGHACGTEHFSSRSLYFSRLNRIFEKQTNIFRVPQTYAFCVSLHVLCSHH